MQRSTPLVVGTIAMALSALVSLFFGDLLDFAFAAPMALSFGLMATGADRKSSGARWLVYGLLAASFVAVGFDLLA